MDYRWTGYGVLIAGKRLVKTGETFTSEEIPAAERHVTKGNAERIEGEPAIPIGPDPEADDTVNIRPEKKKFRNKKKGGRK